MNRTTKLATAFSVLLTGAGLLTACGGGGSSSTPSSPQPATTNVSMSDPATCAGSNGSYSHVYVTVKDVQASTDGSTWVDVTPGLSSKPMQVDLLGQANNQCFLAMLGSTTQLQPGDYQQIRLILQDNNSASVVANNQCGNSGANCVVLNDGTTETLQLSSEAQTGIKINAASIAGGKFTVAAGQTKDLNIDFNTCASLVTEGNGKVRLKPVLHAGEVAATSTSINGTVVDSATGKAVTGGNVMVALEQPDSKGIDRVVMATNADANGNFVFCPIPAGTYDVVAVGVNGSNVSYAATVTTGVANGSTIANIQLKAVTGVNTAPATLTGQVTTAGASTGTAADIQLSALQTATVNGKPLTFTMPLAQQQSATASLSTAAGATCAPNTDCATYSLNVPAANPNAGAFSASGTTWTQDATSTVDYSVEGQAFVPSSGGTTDCSPSTVTSTQTTANANLTVTPGVSVQVATMAFTGCQ